ncbi:sulfite exporter TauE/SafE family protein [Ochrobactrum soli]|uniref:Sulfite exporter TauE/SafE family protein n=2 Tax=Ochrobactrum TaxID=528 RepID=A0A849KX91_9HYPH|nr:sulfite exporter TauE/SafE family protein [[Ochrobactrum] soli]NNU63208.1 sulfite exporter TauE/SafE family protein [[Ochrobactrum] soli]
MTLELILASGMLTGLASSLHCAGLCGGVASLFVSVSQPAGGFSTSQRLNFLVRMQLGRATVYVAAGMVAGSLGYYIQSMMLLAGFQNFLRYVAAFMIILTGLSIIGFLPSPSKLEGRFSFFAIMQKSALKLRPRSPYQLGAALGLAPCAMVLNALLTAALFSDIAAGALYMSGFAVVALPGVVISGFGISSMSSLGLSAKRNLRRIVGTALVVTGVFFTTIPEASISALCLG